MDRWVDSSSVVDRENIAVSEPGLSGVRGAVHRWTGGSMKNKNTENGTSFTLERSTELDATSGGGAVAADGG